MRYLATALLAACMAILIVCGTAALADDYNGLQESGAAAFDGSHDGQMGTPLPATLTPTGTTQTVDWDDGNVQFIDLESATGDVTLTLSNPTSGFSYGLVIQQDGASAVDVVWPAAVLWPGGVAPTISIGNDAIDVVTCLYSGTTYKCDRGANYQ